MYGDACVLSAGKTLRQVTGLLGSDHSQLVRDAADAREELPALYGKTVGQRVRNIYIIYVAKTEAEALTALVLAHSVYTVQCSVFKEDAQCAVLFPKVRHRYRRWHENEYQNYVIHGKTVKEVRGLHTGLRVESFTQV